MAPGKSAEVLIVSRHLAAYNPRTIVPATSDADGAWQGADARNGQSTGCCSEVCVGDAMHICGLQAGWAEWDGEVGSAGRLES